MKSKAKISITKSLQKKDSTKKGILKVSKTTTKSLPKKVSKNNTKTLLAKEPKELVTYKSSDLIIPEKMEVLNEFVDKIPVISDMLEWWQKFSNTEAVINKLEINEKLFAGELKTCSFKVYSGILKKLDTIAKKYQMYKKQDLLNAAIIEFYEKYK